MNISVVICAYTERRWDDVHAAVASVRAQRHRPYEIILVVDHNPDLLQRLAASLPEVTVVANAERRGLSGGKNTGVAVARGDVVAFLDDDAVAAPGWLAAFAKHYDDPAVAGVGGRTLALWPGSPSSAELRYGHRLLEGGEPAEAGRRPAWFPEEFDWTVGCTYRGMVPGPIRNLMGGNASFRREVFAVAGGFADGIGRSHHRRPLGCEETEFCIRLRQRSPRSELVYDEEAVIWHRVPAERARFAYFRERCYAEGLSKALVTRSVGTGDGLASERAHALRTLPRGVARGLRAAVRGDAAGLGRAAAITVGLAWTVWGYGVGSASGVRRSEEPAMVGAQR
ncbi:Glycosyltransferase, GT2 family [Thermomonospora echinospora]|uniref:Glycosyltransferase, GT2 family n=1 Tax=Thermomonospora echinospora TaxID=1992 RepID=A0A1H5UY03_9ACTN|nr:glycosyltransferase family 2 protein [Thermomonospora echinospora]SEF79893.1 Glycosyltransferase, GT2 family [Thermomonospora echinospora]